MYFLEIGFVSCNQRLQSDTLIGQSVIGQIDKPITIKIFILSQPFTDFNRIAIATTKSQKAKFEAKS